MDNLNYNEQDRSLAKALTNQLIDTYFSDRESWLRAILRMCIFSVTHLEGQAALLIECPNQAVAKRLSRKTHYLLSFAEHFTHSPHSARLLLCYCDRAGVWQAYDSKTQAWIFLKNLDPFTARADGLS
ncbi:MAG: hypothetical protein ACM37W_22050 [Actinomycetota bacterium]